MVSGAVVIGRPIGPGMIRPFGLGDFDDFVKYCGLSLNICGPRFEVAYPESLRDLVNEEYIEGVLVNVVAKDVRDSSGFESYVYDSIADAAEVCERKIIKCQQKRISLQWDSDLDYQKVSFRGVKPDNLSLEPCYKVLEVYPDSDFVSNYSRIVGDFSYRTMKARVKFAEVKERLKNRKDMDVIGDFIVSHQG